MCGNHCVGIYRNEAKFAQFGCTQFYTENLLSPLDYAGQTM